MLRFGRRTCSVSVPDGLSSTNSMPLPKARNRAVTAVAGSRLSGWVLIRSTTSATVCADDDVDRQFHAVVAADREVRAFDGAHALPVVQVRQPSVERQRTKPQVGGG